MSRHRKAQPPAPVDPEIPGYDTVLAGMVEFLESARRAAARTVNAVGSGNLRFPRRRLGYRHSV
jgi:hypothetical protein